MSTRPTLRNVRAVAVIGQRVVCGGLGARSLSAPYPTGHRSQKTEPPWCWRTTPACACGGVTSTVDRLPRSRASTPIRSRLPAWGLAVAVLRQRLNQYTVHVHASKADKTFRPYRLRGSLQDRQYAGYSHSYVTFLASTTRQPARTLHGAPGGIRTTRVGGADQRQPAGLDLDWPATYRPAVIGSYPQAGGLARLYWWIRSAFEHHRRRLPGNSGAQSLHRMCPEQSGCGVRIFNPLRTTGSCGLREPVHHHQQLRRHRSLAPPAPIPQRLNALQGPILGIHPRTAFSGDDDLHGANGTLSNPCMGSGSKSVRDR